MYSEVSCNSPKISFSFLLVAQTRRGFVCLYVVSGHKSFVVLCTFAPPVHLLAYLVVWMFRLLTICTCNLCCTYIQCVCVYAWMCVAGCLRLFAFVNADFRCFPFIDQCAKENETKNLLQHCRLPASLLLCSPCLSFPQSIAGGGWSWYALVCNQWLHAIFIHTIFFILLFWPNTRRSSFDFNLIEFQ